MNAKREIKVPLSQVWREFRMRYVPAGVFLCGLVAAVYLWNVTVVGPAMVGEVEVVESNVVTPDAGLLTNVMVRPFQIVKRGDPVAEVAGSAIRLMSGQVQDLRNRIAMSQMEIRSAVDVNRMAFDYQSLAMNTLRVRAELASAKAELPTVEAAYTRAEMGWKEKVVPYNDYEESLRIRDSLRARISELEKLVNEAEGRLKQAERMASAFSGMGTNANTSDVIQRLNADRLDVEDSRRDTLILRSPIDGIVGEIKRQKGQNVMAGDTIMTIHAMESDRIVAYLHQGANVVPTKGMPVRVRCRSKTREEAMGKVEEIGFRYEPISKGLMRQGTTFETGMPIGVSMPAALRTLLRPGELVDLALEP